MRTTLLVPIILLTLCGCAPSGNGKACELFAGSYNELADAVASGEDPDELWGRMEDMHFKIDEALITATGIIRIEMEASRDANLLVDRTGTGQEGIDFLYSTTLVASACAEDGHPIALQSFSDE